MHESHRTELARPRQVSDFTHSHPARSPAYHARAQGSCDHIPSAPQYPPKLGEHDPRGDGASSTARGPAGRTQQFSHLLPSPHPCPPTSPSRLLRGGCSCSNGTLITGLTAGPGSPTSHRPRSDLSVNVQGPQTVPEPSTGSCSLALTKDYLPNTPEMPRTLEGAPASTLAPLRAQPALGLPRILESGSALALKSRHTGSRRRAKVPMVRAGDLHTAHRICSTLQQH